MKRKQKQTNWTPEDIARHKAIREQFQRERPGPDDFDDLVPHGEYMDKIKEKISTIDRLLDLIGKSIPIFESMTDLSHEYLVSIVTDKKYNPEERHDFVKARDLINKMKVECDEPLQPPHP